MELNDVIKALECCAAPVTKCDDCPVDKAKKDDCVCGVYVAGEALKVIKELTEENERVRAQNEVLEIKNKDFKYRIYELSKDNEEWERENKDLECDNDMLRERITETRSDTVREMQERFKMYFGTYFLGYEIPLSEALKAVNQIAKEMLDGGKSK